MGLGLGPLITCVTRTGLKIFLKIGKTDRVSEMGKGLPQLNTTVQRRCEVNQKCVFIVKVNMIFNVLHKKETIWCLY